MGPVLETGPSAYGHYCAQLGINASPPLRSGPSSMPGRWATFLSVTLTDLHRSTRNDRLVLTSNPCFPGPPGRVMRADAVARTI